MSGMSKHGELRIRKRLGKPRKIAAKLAAAAWEGGYPIKTFTGYFKKYLLHHARYYRTIVRVHKGDIYFFGSDAVLITVWQVPAQYRKQLKDRLPHATDGA